MIRFHAIHAIAIFTGLLLSSCATLQKGIDRDLEYPGGVGGSIIDKYYPVETSALKQHQLFRTAVAFAVLSRAATINIRSGKDAEAYLGYLDEAITAFNTEAGSIYEATEPHAACTPAALTGCVPVLFEGDIWRVEASGYKLGIAVLPRREAAKLAQSVEQRDLFGSLRAAAMLAYRSIETAHAAAGIHRASMEVWAQALLPEGCRSNAPSCADKLQTIVEALCYLGEERAGGIECPPVIAAMGIGALTSKPHHRGGTPYDRQVNDYRRALAGRPIAARFYAPLFIMIQDSCRLLPLDLAGNEELAVRELRRLRDNRCARLRFQPVARTLLTEQATSETNVGHDTQDATANGATQTGTMQPAFEDPPSQRPHEQPTRHTPM